MGNIIKISTRRNLFFVINIIIYYYLRKADLIIINKVFKFNDSLIFTLLMLSGEFFAGLSIYIYQILFLKKNIQTVNISKLHLLSLLQKLSVLIIFLKLYYYFFQLFLILLNLLLEHFISQNFLVFYQRLNIVLGV